jgi:hypothetical protein
MDIEIRVYVKQGDLMTSLVMLLNENSLYDVISTVLRRDGLIKKDELIEHITYEGIHF